MNPQNAEDPEEEITETPETAETPAKPVAPKPIVPKSGNPFPAYNAFRGGHGNGPMNKQRTGRAAGRGR